MTVEDCLLCPLIFNNVYLGLKIKIFLFWLKCFPQNYIVHLCNKHNIYKLWYSKSLFAPLKLVCGSQITTERKKKENHEIFHLSILHLSLSYPQVHTEWRYWLLYKFKNVILSVILMILAIRSFYRLSILPTKFHIMHSKFQQQIVPYVNIVLWTIICIFIPVYSH